MQTMAVQIQDSSQNITILKDKNLEYDPYFYERQEELHELRADIKSSKIEMVSHKQVWGNIKNHLKTIENR